MQPALVSSAGVASRLGLIVCLAFAAGCSGSGSSPERPAAPSPTRLTGLGLRIDVPRGWDGRIAERERLLPGAALVHVASFPLPAPDDEAASKAQAAIGGDDVLLTVSEALPGQALPLQTPRIGLHERGVSVGRYTVVDRYFVEKGRAFLLHATFGAGPPPDELIRRLNRILASLTIEPRARPLSAAPDPAPAEALAPARLSPTPARVVVQCKLAQARASFPILCPARLPRPFIGWPRDEPPRVVAEILLAPGASSRSRAERRRAAAGGVSVGYGAPWEPDSGPDWQLHLWRNRPCCFLHFEVFRRHEGPQHVPAGAVAAELGGRKGLVKDATTYGVMSRTGDYLYWANHTRFLWRENGIPYVATLHRFGTKDDTRALLGRLVRELRPARTFRS